MCRCAVAVLEGMSQEDEAAQHLQATVLIRHAARQLRLCVS